MLSERNARSSPELYRTVGKGPRPVLRLLVERVGRDGEEHHREDNCGKVVRRWPAWRLLLLFKRFRGPAESSTHIPNTGHSTRAQVPRIPIDPHPLDTIGSSNRLRITVWPDDEVDRPAPQRIQHFDSHHR